MTKKRGLGKSLDALLAYTQAPTHHQDESTDSLQQMSVKNIQRGKYQPRQEMDPESLEELASSIKHQGIIQPLIVRPISDHKYEIIAGERRWRAAQLAGLEQVPVIIRHIPDEAALAVALIENIQRENLNPLDEAIAYERLANEFNFTHQQVADAVGKSRAAVTNFLRLLALPEAPRRFLEQGLLEMGHARAIITLPQELQNKAAEIIVARQLSVRDAENLVRQLQNPMQKNIKSKNLSPELKDMEENLKEILRLKVAIQCNARGKGKVVIHYKNLAELNALLDQFATT